MTSQLDIAMAPYNNAMQTDVADRDVSRPSESVWANREWARDEEDYQAEEAGGRSPRPVTGLADELRSRARRYSTAQWIVSTVSVNSLSGIAMDSCWHLASQLKWAPPNERLDLAAVDCGCG